MFCPNCGVELTEETAFCPFCGSPVAPEEIPADTSAEQPAEETAAAPASLDDLLADVKETFHLEGSAASSEEEPTVPEAESSDTPAPEEASTYSQPAPVSKKAKKKSGKAVRILVPILAVVVLLAAAAGVLFLANETYDKATECLAVQDYEQAQELYGRFPFFKDSRSREELLISQQQAYDQAAQLVQQHAYKEAQKGYSALGNYRDSQTLLMTEVPYLQAVYLMESAATGNADALTQLPAFEGAAPEESAEISLYSGAAALFRQLGDYQDSAANASTCYLRLASAFMAAERYEEALACQVHMNPADAEASLAEYMTYCDDGAVLDDLDKVVRMRYAQESAETEQTDLATVTAELDVLLPYVDAELMFYDAELTDLLAAYIGGLETEISAIDAEGHRDDLVTWYTGRAARSAVVERLIASYNFLGDDPALQASFAGAGAYYEAAAVIEKTLGQQLIGVTGESSEDAGDFLVFENTTGYRFSLSLHNEFFNEDGESVFLHQTEPVSVPVDSTVRIPVLFPEDDWSTWQTGWEFTVDLT